MIIETWFLTVDPGKDAEFQDWSRRRREANKRQLPSINGRLLKQATGKVNKYIAISEFDSYEARYAFWNNLSDEIIDLMKEREEKGFFDVETLEHYFYDVME